VLHYILGALILHSLQIHILAEETATGSKRFSKPPTFFDPALKPQLSRLEAPSSIRYCLASDIDKQYDV
jgi:hypothetical protein